MIWGLKGSIRVFLLQDIPKYEVIRECSSRYPDVDPSSLAVGLVLLRVASDLLSGMEGYYAEHGLSQGRFTVLMLLNREPDASMSPSDLAERSGVSRATMTGLLDGLERDGLIDRRASSEDRRMQRVSLSERGRTRLQDMLPEYFRRKTRVMSALDEADRMRLLGLLESLMDGVKRFNEGEGAIERVGGRAQGDS